MAPNIKLLVNSPNKTTTTTHKMVAEIKRSVKLVTEQHTINKPSDVEGFPMRAWSIEVFLVHEITGDLIPANVFQKVVYNLHPSFAQPVQTFTTAPFRCANEGWGEFDMTIDLYTTEKGGKNSLQHDLNFHSDRYESDHKVTFKNPSQALMAQLRESGPLAGEGGVNGSARAPEKKRKKNPIDIEKLGEKLTKLQEDDLLYVVQMIHDNKTDDTYTLNDPEAGEFHVDLYTLPDMCLKMLQSYANDKLANGYT